MAKCLKYISTRRTSKSWIWMTKLFTKWYYCLINKPKKEIDHLFYLVKIFQQFKAHTSGLSCVWLHIVSITSLFLYIFVFGFMVWRGLTNLFEGFHVFFYTLNFEMFSLMLHFCRQEWLCCMVKPHHNFLNKIEVTIIIYYLSKRCNILSIYRPHVKVWLNIIPSKGALASKVFYFTFIF